MMRNRILMGTILSLLFLFNLTAQYYPAQFDYNTLDGSNGFMIEPMEDSLYYGYDLRFVGDINGDGYEDIGFGQGYQDLGDFDIAGRAYIVYGKASGFPSVLELATFDSSTGIIIEGTSDQERRGRYLSGAGDINNDGVDDLIVGTDGQSEVLVIYGNSNLPAKITHADINGTNGFYVAIDGHSTTQVSGLGDVNGDNIDDFIVGQSHWSGRAWVIFGRNGNFPTTVDKSYLDGAKGFVTGSFEGSRPAYRVGGPGDINNDGINDILVGNWSRYGDTDEYTVGVYGKSSGFAPLVTMDPISAAEGFKVVSPHNFDYRMNVGPVGDINNDGIDDFFSGNHIVFGSATLSQSILGNNLNGSNGFAFSPRVNFAVPAGDVNFDGIDDMLVNSNNSVFVVFGKNGGFPSILDPANIDGSNGFVIKNAKGNLRARIIDGGKDINGDGKADFMFVDGGAFNDRNPIYVVFGGDHYALPFNDGYPYATNITNSSFELFVNTPEAGTAYYIVYPNNQKPTSYDDIINGNQAVVYGNFPINTPNVDVFELVDGLDASTTYDVYVFYKDEAGNNSSIFLINDLTTLQFVDNTPPTLSCLSNQTVDCNLQVLPDYTTMVTVSDDIDTDVEVTQTPAAGSPIASGMTVQITAKDDAGNTSGCSFIVSHEVDNEPPSMDCASLDNYQFTGDLPNFTQLLTATDNCDQNPSVTQSPAPGTPLEAGMEVRITATDASGNATICKFNINIQNIPDTEPPVISCLSDQVLACGDVIPDYTGLISVTDNIDPDPEIIQSPVAGSPFVPGMEISILARDVKGNESVCSFIINKEDNVSPEIVCLSDQIVDYGSSLPDFTSVVSVSDNCSGALQVSQVPEAGVEVVSAITVVMTVIDESGNEKSCSFLVSPDSDVIAPSISCIGNQLLDCDQPLPNYTSMMTVSDDRDPSPVITQLPAAGSEFTPGMIVTVIATDNSGNSNQCQFQVDATEVPEIDAGDDMVISPNQKYVLMPTVSDNGDGEFLWSPDKWMDNNQIRNPEVSPVESIEYRLVYTNEFGCSAEDYVYIDVKKLPGSYGKYGISIDNDGVNETLVFEGIEEYPDNHLTIFNRWGNLVFEMSNYNNGSRVFTGIANRLNDIGSGKLPEGTYFYTLTLSPEMEPIKGFIVIKR
ncbi:HYR domain-containing protein [Marinigracilibium pacificum]|uniref:HYR domain-containing protein n=1 Tax=Marinigracilibium pacificum TaxID=2729599 RepID=A0A848J2G2_9BACT|nr:HYR domain-containing protein [Marinigracilibium pacificum]NMM48730.1 HYR domain-containing protein [Marinigracilibium pacificum]